MIDHEYPTLNMRTRGFPVVILDESVLEPTFYRRHILTKSVDTQEPVSRENISRLFKQKQQVVSCMNIGMFRMLAYSTLKLLISPAIRVYVPTGTSLTGIRRREIMDPHSQFMRLLPHPGPNGSKPQKPEDFMHPVRQATAECNRQVFQNDVRDLLRLQLQQDLLNLIPQGRFPMPCNFFEGQMFLHVQILIPFLFQQGKFGFLFLQPLVFH